MLARVWGSVPIPLHRHMLRHGVRGLDGRFGSGKEGSCFQFQIKLEIGWYFGTVFCVRGA